MPNTNNTNDERNLMIMRVVNKLGTIREQKGLSQEQLAWKSTVSRQTISEIELERRIPSVKTALLLAKALECTVEDIFSLEGKIKGR